MIDPKLKAAYIRLGMTTSVAAFAASIAAPPACAKEATQRFDIPAQPLSKALLQLGRQARISIAAPSDLTKGRMSKPVAGEMTAKAALATLLDGTGLEFSFVSASAVRIAAGNGHGGAELASLDGQAAPESSAAISGSADQGGLAEILVVGSRSLNADIRRTENDAQPYVIFSQDEIRSSNASNLDDFLRTRLPQNAQRQGINDIDQVNAPLSIANAGPIDLRGLGSGQTLVLVDGRRMPGANYFDIQQANVNGIPLAAIERIEVLPSTAGAIYGGSAVGGVVNIVLRRDYRGIEARIDYGNTFDGTTGDFKASLLGGFNLGSTRIMIRASRDRVADLSLADRGELLVGAREFLLGNNPAAFAPPLLLAGGRTGNVCATNASGSICNATRLVLDNGTPLNASITYVPLGYSGPSSDGGAALVANAGRFQIDAPASEQTLIQGTRTESLGFNVSQPIFNWLELFGDASWDRVRGNWRGAVSARVPLAANSPLNPFQQNIAVLVPLPGINSVGGTEVSTLRLSGGLIARLPHSWALSLEQAWNRSRSSSFVRTPLLTQAARDLLAPFALGDVTRFPPPEVSAALSESVSEFGPVETTSINSAARLAGPLFSLPGGRATATLLAERRLDKLDPFFTAFPPTYVLAPARRQEVRSLYLETRLPIIGVSNAVPALRSLELQGSVRYDHYETRGTSDQFVLTSPDAPHPAPTYFTNRVESIDYLAGVKWTPFDGVILRGSYSTGFLPPGISQLSPQVDTPSVANIPGVSDPRRGGEDLVGDANGNIARTSAGNPNLDPERSRSFSFGLVLQPRLIPELRFSADYTVIRKSNEISTIGLQQLIDNEERFPDRITRGANRPGDPVGYAGPITAYDLSLINVAKSRAKAWDFQLNYELKTRFGRFQPYAIATHQTVSARSLIAGDPVASRLGFFDGPLAWRGNVGVNWSLGGLSLGWNMQFYDSYRICRSTDLPAACNTRNLNQGGERIPSQSYHDVSARYEFDESSSLLAGTEIAVGVQNLFNKRPPEIGVSSLSGFYSSYGDARLRRFTLSLRRRFGL